MIVDKGSGSQQACSTPAGALIARACSGHGCHWAALHRMQLQQPSVLACNFTCMLAGTSYVVLSQDILISISGRTPAVRCWGVL